MKARFEKKLLLVVEICQCTRTMSTPWGIIYKQKKISLVP
jgi:hypothetical protein